MDLFDVDAALVFVEFEGVYVEGAHVRKEALESDLLLQLDGAVVVPDLQLGVLFERGQLHHGVPQEVEHVGDLRWQQVLIHTYDTNRVRGSNKCLIISQEPHQVIFMFRLKCFILDHLWHKEMEIRHENPKDFIVLLIGQFGLHVVANLLPNCGQRVIIVHLEEA